MRPSLDVDHLYPVLGDQVEHLQDVGNQTNDEACSWTVRNHYVRGLESMSIRSPRAILGFLNEGMDDGDGAEYGRIPCRPERLVHFSRPCDPEHIPCPCRSITNSTLNEILELEKGILRMRISRREDVSTMEVSMWLELLLDYFAELTGMAAGA